MTPQARKKLILCSVALALVTTLLATLVLTTPYLVRSRSFKNLIVALVYDRTGGRLDYTALHLKLSPHPLLHIQRPSLTLPKGGDARAERLSVTFRALPLLAGRLRLLELILESPRATIPLGGTATTGSRRSDEEDWSVARMTRFIERLKNTAGRATIHIREGRLELLVGDKIIDSWRDLALTYTAEANMMRLEARASSAAGGDVRADLLIEPVSLDVDGRIDVGELALSDLMAQIYPHLPLTVSEGRLRLGIHLNAQQFSAFDVRLSATTPAFSLRQRGQTLRLGGLQLEAGLQRLSDEMRIELTSLKTTQPALAISGTARQFKDADWHLNLTAQPFDVASLRTQALAWAGDLAAVDILFDILRSGRIQSISASSSAGTLRELPALNRIKLVAQVDGVNLRIPGTALDMKAVAGRVDLDQGVLAVRVDSGGPVGTHLADGRFRIDLTKASLPLEAKADLQTDLVELPEILSKVLGPEAQRAVAAEIETLSGTAGGRFEIKGPAADLHWAVEVDDLEARFKSPRLPMWVEIEAAAGRYADANLTVDTLSGRVGHSTVEGVSGNLSFGKRPLLKNGRGRFILALGELLDWAKTWDAAREALRPIQSVDGRLAISDFQFSGPLNDPLTGDYLLQGRLLAARVTDKRLPVALALSGGALRAASDQIQVSGLKATLAGTKLTTTGTLDHPFSDNTSLDLSMDGIISPRIATWALDRWGGGERVAIKHPIALSRLSVVSDLKGTHAISAALQPVDGPALTAELRLAPNKLAAPALTVTDAFSDARFAFERENTELSVRFNGRLDIRSLNPFLKSQAPRSGWVAGDWRVTLAGRNWWDTHMTGQLQGGDFAIPLPDEEAEVPLLERFSLTATGSQLVIHSAALQWEEMALTLDGWLGRGERGLDFDLHARSPFINGDKLLARIQESAKTPPPVDTQGSTSQASWRSDLTGNLRIDIDHLQYRDRHIRPLAAKIRVDDERVQVEVPQADLCDISVAGGLTVTPTQMALQLEPTSAAQNVGRTLACLFQKPIQADGRLYLVGDLTAKGSPKDLVNKLDGPVSLRANEGRIYEAKLLAKILALVNVTEIFAGQYPGFTEEGMVYKRFELDGRFKNGVFAIDTCSLDSPTLQMTCKGHVDLPDESIDITVLAAPLKTVDRIIKHLPAIGYVLGGSLISIPIKVHGSLRDPTVVPLSPSAVGEGLLEMMKRTFQLPVKLFAPPSAGP